MNKRRIFRARTRLLAKVMGSKREANKSRCDAADLRIQDDLCLCGDEQKYYLSKEEAAADTSPKVTCGDCGKEKLRVEIVTVDRLPSDNERLGLTNLLK